MGRFLKAVMKNSQSKVFKGFALVDLFDFNWIIPTGDRKVEAMLLGEWDTVIDHDERTHRSVAVTFSHYKGENYVIGAKFADRQ